ncbi:AAA family ATPase [Nocardia miyunensis]|uniref:AAA family ATPase n=1 Tax=Nocardia miyunensis TaxID=282684 RepID=UPI000ACF4B30|nr:AAA family ATPase [Nocardia miyunensis]
MLDPNICPRCGERAARVTVDGDRWLCPHCGHDRAFRRLPLLALTGPSGAGKSTVAAALAHRLAGRAVVLEQDVLWVAGLRDDIDGHPEFRSVWLRLAAMIHQNGLPVVLCGTVAPPEFEPLPERAFFTDIHYLALVADPATLAARLRARPAWRAWDEPRIDEMIEFADWLRHHAATLDPPVELLDTTTAPLTATVDHVHSWIDRVLEPSPPPTIPTSPSDRHADDSSTPGKSRR